VQQPLQDLALLAVSRLAKEHSDSQLTYSFRWYGNKLLVINRTVPPNNVPAGKDGVIVSETGIGGADLKLVSLLEKTIVQIADPNDARDIGYAHAIAGKPPIEGLKGAYETGYNLAIQNKVHIADVEKPA
jgi:hypothetical protein